MNWQGWSQSALVVVVLILTVLHIGKRFDDMNRRFDDVKDWIRGEIRRLEDSIERSLHPIVHP